jgi:hypothetical protein
VVILELEISVNKNMEVGTLKDMSCEMGKVFDVLKDPVSVCATPSIPIKVKLEGPMVQNIFEAEGDVDSSFGGN